MHKAWLAYHQPAAVNNFHVCVCVWGGGVGSASYPADDAYQAQITGIRGWGIRLVDTKNMERL